MTINNYGFAGTINAAQWSTMSTLLGNQACVLDGSSFAVSAVSGQRQVSIAAGTAFADGVMTVSTAAEVRTVSVPTNGQWFLLVLRRNWSTAAADFALLASDTTTTSFPTAPPSTYPSMNANPGVISDQAIAWVWSNSANTTLQIVDLRMLPVRSYVNEPNDFINGAFDHWQRGISFASTTMSAYTADRWLAESSVASLATVSRQPFTPGECPGGFESRYYLRYQRSGSAPTGTSYLRHRINDVRTKAGKTVTFSFYARNSAVSTEQLGVWVTQNFGSGGSTSNVVQGTVGQISTAWTRYSFSITLGKLSGKTIGENSYLEFAIGITSPFGLNSMDFWGYQDDTGTAPATFRRHAPSVLAELSACYPYYDTSYEGVVPGTPNWIGHNRSDSAYEHTTTSYIAGNIEFHLPMRRIPDVVLYSPATGAINAVLRDRMGVSSTDGSVYVDSNSLGKGACKIFSSGTALASGIAWHYTANAEL